MSNEALAEVFGNYWKDDAQNVMQQIEEIPFMFSTQHEIVCMKNSSDEATIGFVGKSSAGKTYSGHAFVDRLYWYRGASKIVDNNKVHVCIANDYQNETMSWSSGNSNSKQIEKLEWLNEQPRSLPVVYMLPVTSTMPEPDFEYLKISIPFEEALKDLDYYINMKNSGLYLRAMLKDFKGMSFKQVYDLISNIKTKVDPKSKEPGKLLQKGVKAKILAVLSDLEREGIFSDDDRVITEVKVLDRNQATKEVEEHYYNPIVGIMYANLVPSLITVDLIGKRYYEAYLRYFYDSIFTAMRVDDYFSRKDVSVYVYVPELAKLCSTENRIQPSAEMLRTYAAQGRFNRLGFVWDAQVYTKVEKDVRINTRYLFSLKYQSSEQRNAIADDFDLSDYQKDLIGKLPKFGMLGMTSEKFVCYGMDGKRYETDEPVEGISLPTLSLHAKPKPKQLNSEE